MSYSNANYLINPNKLSTKVHYAPGGASSLSLAWDNTPTVRQERPRQQQQNAYYKQQTEPMQNYPSTVPQRVEQRQGVNYYTPQSQQYSPQNEDPNRILEAELQYYQNRNKLLQHNVLGGYESGEQGSSYPRHQQYTPPSNAYTPNSQYSKYAPEQGYHIGQQQNYQQEIAKYNQRPEELDLAIQQHRKRQESSSSQQYGQYVGSNQQRTSVRVNNPPGGRSNIVFG